MSHLLALVPPSPTNFEAAPEDEDVVEVFVMIVETVAAIWTETEDLLASTIIETKDQVDFETSAAGKGTPIGSEITGILEQTAEIAVAEVVIHTVARGAESGNGEIEETLSITAIPRRNYAEVDRQTCALAVIPEMGI